MKIRNCATLGLVLSSLGFARAAEAAVIVVDAAGGPGSQFATLQPAIDAAANGDILLIRAGSYDPAMIDDKDLTLQGEGLPWIRPSFSTPQEFRIVNLAAAKRVVLRGLRFDGGTSSSLFAPISPLFISGNAGTVWLDSCSIGVLPNKSVEVFFSGDVVVTHCDVRGGNGFWFFNGPFAQTYPAFPAIDITYSSVFVDGSTLAGGDGVDAISSDALSKVIAGEGAPALRIVGGAALLTSSSLTGGDGGDGDDHPSWGCQPAARGGPGIHLWNGSPTVHVVATTFVAGASGVSVGACPPPSAGPPALVDTGTLVPVSGNPGGFVASSPIREGQTLTLTTTDTSGAVVLLLASAVSNSLPLLPYAGALHVGAPLLVAPLGTIPAGGSLGVPVVVPNLPAGILGVTVFTQAASCPPAAPCALTPPAAVVVLDSSL